MRHDQPARYDALLLVSFGGPEGPADIPPFLQNVTRGRDVPPARLAAVAARYRQLGGMSPANGQCRQLLSALRARFDLPWYWGNRNWHPLLPETVATMARAGVQRALALVTSAYGSYSACRQYLDDFEAARAAVGAGAPQIDKIRHFNDHPGYVAPFADGVRKLWDGCDPRETRVIFTAHAIPVAMNASSGPTGGRYLAQVRQTASAVAGAVGQAGTPGLTWDLAWQSRSGPSRVPWLEPDVNQHLVRVRSEGVKNVIVCPIGFVFENFELLWDLDREAAATARRLGMTYARVPAPASDPRFVAMIEDLVLERLHPERGEPGIMTIPAGERCPTGCCTQSY